jgi:class 3 adenylate cyclase
MSVSVDAARSDSERQLLGASAVIYGGGALATIAVAITDWLLTVPGYSAGGLILLASISLVASLMFAILWRFDVRMAPWVYFVCALAGVAVITTGQVLYTAPPSLGPMLLLYPTLIAYGFLPRLLSIILMGWTGLALAFIFWTQDGWDPPITYWLFVAIATATATLLVAQLVERAEVQTRRANVANDRLRTLNTTLEERVAEQVMEVERLGRLRRFLSAPVAEQLLAAGEAEQDDWLQPHRAKIAALFCDLRGFTRFSVAAEPEDVTDVLAVFHREMGVLAERHSATVGGYSGDGVLLYFNDPVPSEDPAGSAIRLAQDFAAAIETAAEEWRTAGFDVGWGIGIAFGWATLAVIGSDSRRDYTPLGSVVNLAARLSDVASHREILMDRKTFAATDAARSAVDAGQYDLKGFAEPVQVYRIGPQSYRPVETSEQDSMDVDARK